MGRPEGLEDRVGLELEVENLGNRAIQPKGGAVISNDREAVQLHGNESVMPDAMEEVLMQLPVIKVSKKKKKKKLLLDLGIGSLASKCNKTKKKKKRKSSGSVKGLVDQSSLST
ncbi:hypothetical protein U1Q18_015546 [Sarracenia purpurea var. burkii]